MSRCNSCGGVLGRDCFNPIECAQITHSQDIRLEQTVEALTLAVARLTAALINHGIEIPDIYPEVSYPMCAMGACEIKDDLPF